MIRQVAYATPSVLRWARDVSGFSVDQAAAKLKISPERIRAVESGHDRLTMRQLERLAAYYERPLALFFLAAPPDEEPVATQFRRLRDAPAPPWGPELRHLVRQVQARQEDAAELYELLEVASAWRTATIAWANDPEALGNRARDALNMPLSAQREWRDRAGWKGRRAWIEAVEALGVLVMQSGDLSTATMRGFAAPHPVAPVIVVNTNDDPRARVFTLIHELGHLVNERSGSPNVPAGEDFYESFAGATLMPAKPFSDDLQRERLRSSHLLDAVDETALIYGVTPLAALVRARRLKRVTYEEFTGVREQLGARAESLRGKGGDYYRNTIGGLGPSFIGLVFEALDVGAVSYATASGMLGVKSSNFRALRDQLMEGAPVV